MSVMLVSLVGCGHYTWLVV